MRTVAALFVLAVAGTALGQESKLALKEGPGKDRAMQCVACHSLDYIHMNSRFLDKAGWTASVNKMVKVFGAQLSAEDVEIIATYLARNYGRPRQ